MKDLKHLSDDELIANTEALVRKEREVLTEILHHLREIERRRLFGKYSSLFAYAVGHLRYSEPQAYRRIEAMRVIRELPELEPAIERGDVDLTLIGVAQAAFASEKKKGRAFSRAKKIEVFEAISGQSSRQAQKTVAQFLPEPPPKKDQVRGIAPGRNLATVERRDTRQNGEAQRLAGAQAPEPLDGRAYEPGLRSGAGALGSCT